MRLTDTAIKSLPAPERGQRIYFDDSLPGFGCRVSQGGTRSFVLQHGRDRSLVTIGRYHPDILPLATARAEAKRLLAETVLGKHRPNSIPFDEGKERFLELCRRKNRARTVYDYTRLLSRHFKFGRRQLMEIGPGDIAKKLDRITAPAERNYATTIIKVFFNWAYSRGYVEQSPAGRFKTSPAKSRDRVLTDDELKKVWRATGDDTFGRLVKLLILTGQRVGEVSNLTKQMFGEGTLSLPASLTKNRRPHAIPLGKLAESYVAPLYFRGFSKAKARLDKASGVGDWTLHDLRRTFASGLAALGVAIPVIEKLLNHVSGSFGGIVGTYQRYDYKREMRDAIERWEHHIIEIVGDETNGDRETVRTTNAPPTF